MLRIWTKTTPNNIRISSCSLMEERRDPACSESSSCWHSTSPEWKRGREVKRKSDLWRAREGVHSLKSHWNTVLLAPGFTIHHHVPPRHFVYHHRHTHIHTHRGQTVFKIQWPFREDSGKWAPSNLHLWVSDLFNFRLTLDLRCCHIYHCSANFYRWNPVF